MATQQPVHRLPRFSHEIEDTENLKDELKRSGLAESIAEEIRRPVSEGHTPPRVIGVYGTWGSGKSYLLSQTINLLLDGNKADTELGVVVCMFSPWRYEVEGDLAPGLIMSLRDIENQFRDGSHRNPEFSKTRADYKRRAETVLNLLVTVFSISVTFSPAGPAAGTASDTILRRWIRGLFRGSDRQVVQKLSRIGEIRQAMQELVKAIIKSAQKKDPKRRKDWRLVVFIDDLDRCSPENMVQMFEWLKMHLLVEDCTYVLALDHEAAARAIVGNYKKYLGEEKDLAYGYRYLEKLVEVEYELEPAPLVEKMALQQILAEDSGYTKVSDVARAESGGDFPGIAYMDELMDLPSLRVPRTILKIVYKYRRALAAITSPEGAALRNSLPASYPFWLLFLTAMYFRLDPSELSDFVRGRSIIYDLLHSDLNRTIPNDVAGPKREFCQYAQRLSQTAGSSMQVPATDALRKLTAILRENTLPYEPR